jgi:hypothetical protein
VGARTDSWKAWLTSSAKANLQPLPPYATAQTPVLDSVARTEIGRIVRVTDSGGRITLGGLRSIDRDTLTIAEAALTLRQIDERAGKLFEMRSAARTSSSRPAIHSQTWPRFRRPCLPSGAVCGKHQSHGLN